MDNSKAVSHFFTLPSQIVQNATQAFGPQSSSTYNISSGFTSTADAKAFAICKGIVLIQSNSSSSAKVNLILKPYKQPISGVNIKYFVYRGLRKSDFFDETGNILASGSDFINKIRADFSSFHNTEPNLPFLAKYIGYDPSNQPDTLLLDDFFFKQSQYVESNGEFIEDEEGFGTFELPMIDIGASLGFFTEGECAIDVVLDYGDYKHSEESGEFDFDLSYARSDNAEITLPGTGQTEDKLIKEQIFQFLDIAAFYGSYTADGTVIIDNNGTKQNIVGQDIYSTVLSNFATKNKLYLYMQGDRTRSYNFYNNYDIGETDNSLKIGASADVLAEREYQTQGWPVIIESPSSASVFIQLVTDNNVNTVLYGQKANIINAAKNNFSNADDLLLPPDENGALGKFTKVLELGNPIAGNNGHVIANFNLIIYQGVSYTYIAGQTVDEDGNTVDIIALPNFFDDVFDLINSEPLLKGTHVDDYTVIASKKVKLINEYYDRKQQGVSAVQTLLVKDSIETGDEVNPLLKRVVYISETIDVYNNAVSLTGKINSNTLSSSGTNGNVNPVKTYKLPKPYYYNLKLFTDSSQTITGLELKVLDDSIANKIIFGLTKDENDSVKASIPTGENTTNQRLFLVDLFIDENGLNSPEGIMYKKYKVGIVAEVLGGKPKLFLPPTDVIVYSLDGKYHFSKAYSDFEVSITDDNNLLIEGLLIL